VAGNFIGTNATGTAVLANGSVGVQISTGATNNIIGTNADGVSDALEGNVISGNALDGVNIQGAGTSGNQVAGNRIGTNAAGTAPLPNLRDGVRIRLGATGNIIGVDGDGVGDTAEGNLISGNALNGVNLFEAASGNFMAGNKIGTDVSGTAALGNASFGVFFQDGASNNTVGGSFAGAGNVIAFNASGVVVGSLPTDTTTVDNVISRNSIFANTPGLGIDLANDGVTLNDPVDADTGPNKLTNFPVITKAEIVGPNLVLKGFARPGAEIELFIADPDPSGFGEGKTYLVTRVEGSADDLDSRIGSYGPGPAGSDTTNRFRFVVPRASLPAPVAAGTRLTSTATIGDPSTSEFSPNVTARRRPRVVPQAADLAVIKAVTPRRPQVGAAVTFTLVVQNLGPSPATGVLVHDMLPPGLSFLGAVATQGAYDPGRGVWAVGNLGVGGVAVLQIRARVNVLTPLVNVAVVTAQQLDPNLANNVASALVWALFSKASHVIFPGAF
jgi:uncharacterized repeat protein (TIGR01451 family)